MGVLIQMELLIPSELISLYLVLTVIQLMYLMQVEMESLMDTLS